MLGILNTYKLIINQIVHAILYVVSNLKYYRNFYYIFYIYAYQN